MPMWTIKICDPDGHRDRDECYGPFPIEENAKKWAMENIPRHITWHLHHLRTLNLYSRADWEARLPDFLATIPHKRGVL